jgi:tetratricopeptide (TPR) repeat protein
LADEQDNALEQSTHLDTHTSPLVASFDSSPIVDAPVDDRPLTPDSSPLTPLLKPLDEAVAPATEVLPVPEASTKPAPSPLPPLAGMQRWWLAGAALLLALLAFLWVRTAPFGTTPTPTAPPPAKVTLNPPPQTTPTLLPVTMIAQDGEILLLVAQFKRDTLIERFDVADRVSEALDKEIIAADLVSTTVEIWSEEIDTVQQARAVLTATNATMMIWGKYDSGRVRVNLEMRDPNDSQKRDYNLTTTDELLTTVNYTVPTEIRLVGLIGLGRLLRNQGDYEAATAAFQRALALNPQDPNTQATLNFYLGHLAEQEGNLPGLNRALTFYSRAIELNHELYLAYYNRGTAQLHRYALQPADEKLLLTTLNAAIADLSLVIKNRPSLRGLVHIRAGKGEQWVADFAQVLKVDPAQNIAISGLCWGYVLAQKPEEALPHCDEAIKHDKSGISNDSRAIAYAQLGRYPEAIADFRIYLDALNQPDSSLNYQRYRGPRC